MPKVNHIFLFFDFGNLEILFRQCLLPAAPVFPAKNIFQGNGNRLYWILPVFGNIVKYKSNNKQYTGPC